ncbi:DUF7344 domain-containing protein [Halobacterium wangiae]|uniref:DUF7344 domain-containing protein n=1 Tax=Halobacterium wangiae TaxID=2902623 RepID=UPI001E5E064D|nr:hypothetical protein [Halobacterium wangiae]
MAHSECYPDKAPRVNTLLETLSSPHRRELIHYFESSPQTDGDSLDALVSHLDTRMPSTTPTNLETVLHHTHLPKLEEEGWIEYDPREEWIQYHGNEDVESILIELARVFSE